MGRTAAAVAAPQPVNILLVDDHPENLLALSAVLGDPGYHLVQASSGPQALLQLLRHDFAVALVDVMMPEMDGFELASLIKQREQSRHIPIIFLTAVAKDATFIHRGYDVGAVDYIPKPLEPEIVRAKVAVFADLYRARQTAKRQAEALRQSELRQKELESLGRYQALADAVPHIVWTAPRAGSLDYLNRLWTDYTGMERAASVGAGWRAAFEPDDLAALLRAWEEAAQRGAEFAAECRITSARDGRARWHLVRVVPMRAPDGAVESWIGTATDIDDAKALVASLRDALRLRDEFLSVASHELRTPLTPVRLQIQTLQKALARAGKAPPDRERFAKGLDMMGRQIDRLTRLVEEMLDIARIQSGKLAFTPEEVDLAALVPEVADRFTDEFARAGCALDLAVHGPAVGSWDRFRIEQVVVNLLTNAMKYGAGKPIHVAVRADGAKALLEVRDEGIGISPQDQPRIFERFERAASAKNFGGLGLGLYIVQQTLLAHDGAIRVESEPGRGATFRVELPLAGGAAARAPAVPSANGAA